MLRSKHILTIGTASLDVFLVGEAFRRQRTSDGGGYVEEFPLGAKIEIDDVCYSTGGGATNAAVTFARQGYGVMVKAKIGDDLAGHTIMKALHNEGIKTAHLICDVNSKTAYATVLLAPNGERTILVYRGISEKAKISDFDITELQADGIYMSSLAGNLELLSAITKTCQKRNIKLAYNPGSRELAKAVQLKPYLSAVEILSLNLEEAQQLFKTKDIKKVLKIASKFSRYVVITDAASGSWVCDSQQIYHAGLYQDVKVVDRTGAGDAFASGFVSRHWRGADIKESLTFAAANATSVVQQIGAKDGILYGQPKLKPMKITVSAL